ncbi:MAG: hypothetical protein LUE93_12260 [Bacteroides sp.]|nr:hypothetical protein [Bacteroides sp.]
MITTLRGCLPHVQFTYFQKHYFPHFYYFGVAHTETGKSIVDGSYLLAEPLHDHYEKQGEEEEKKYQQSVPRSHTPYACSSPLTHPGPGTRPTR